ncbi:hypothetical protein ACSVHK_08020 [Acinetobacter nosocomialis]|nr:MULTISPECIES: hypothetical protein [Acinetobacter calcoaceticus/baumannii complex]SSQ41722.1 Uncharacterised protein [Acinetobacter baumannii]MBD8351149.1 hypothetical protein [Acinetobacter nosocomialis]MBJ8495307.1 hypothetical protein [Acinetobacter nosocomialis]MBJ9726567.1 hypothetical protein [Acinetobacter nosocomialis]MBP1461557.1 hypothetical protein [Acinetobacter nosocomialis]
MNQILTIATFIIGLLTFVIAYIVYFNNSKGDVVVYAKVDMSRQGIILLIIHNIGKGIAQDIKFSGTDFILKNVSDIEIGAFQVGTPILFPDEKLIYCLGTYPILKKSLPDHPLKISITFHSKIALYPYKRKIKNVVTVDINAFSGVDISESTFEREVRKSLNEIASSLRKMSS